MKEYDSDAIDSGGNDSSDVDLALIAIQMKRGEGGGGGHPKNYSFKRGQCEKNWHAEGGSCNF